MLARGLLLAVAMEPEELVQGHFRISVHTIPGDVAAALQPSVRVEEAHQHQKRVILHIGAVLPEEERSAGTAP